jgi:hypothetical protein
MPKGTVPLSLVSLPNRGNLPNIGHLSSDWINNDLLDNLIKTAARLKMLNDYNELKTGWWSG